MKYALISVTDKAGVAEFAKGLAEMGFGILSTGGTAKAIAAAGVDVTEVADHTGFPEMMDGRLKTLHPKVHGGILQKRDDSGHQKAAGEHGIPGIDVVAVNLYAFRETASKHGVLPEEVIENIDIGGPAMVRSAAKNHRDVAVVVDPTDYPRVLDALREGQGNLQPAFARELAGKAFAHTAAYDAAIAEWFDRRRRDDEPLQPFAEEVSVAGRRLQTLRYGENPHQQGAVYATANAVTGPTLAGAKQLCGKELSFNNLLDLDAALGLVLEFEQPACVIVKHNNPCGVAVAADQPTAFTAALNADPVSAFGGIHAYNQPLTKQTAEAIAQQSTFIEALVAPGIEDGAVEVLQDAKGGKNLRVLDLGGLPDTARPAQLRQISGGFLLQESDPPVVLGDLKQATKRAPDDAELAALRFAWGVCKHVRSNAIVLAKAIDGGAATVGIGAGQMSRVDAVQLAVEKAGGECQGAVVASDAFFPFADGLEAAIHAGATAAIQPGGSKRDAEVIDAAEKAGMAMVFTGRRHFRH